MRISKSFSDCFENNQFTHLFLRLEVLKRDQPFDCFLHVLSKFRDFRILYMDRKFDDFYPFRCFHSFGKSNFFNTLYQTSDRNEMKYPFLRYEKVLVMLKNYSFCCAFHCFRCRLSNLRTVQIFAYISRHKLSKMRREHKI